MRNVRLALRVPALLVTTLYHWLLLFLGLPVAGVLGRARAWQTWVTRAWCRTLCSIMGIRVSVEGRPPRGAFLLVTNHLSYIDIPLLASMTRCTFVSKSEVGEWPVIGYLSRLAGTVFVDRKKRRDVVRVGSEIRQILSSDQGLVLFPEGTSTSGGEVAPFLSSLLEPVAALEYPVLFAAIRYATPAGEVPAHLGVAWWGGMTLGPHLLELLRMSRIEARIVFGEESIRDGDRKSLAVRLQHAVASRFEPLFEDDDECLTSHTSPAGS